MKIQSPRTMITVCLLLATLASCGGGEDSSPSSSSGGTVPPPAGRIAQIEFLGGDMQNLIATSSGIYGIEKESGSLDKVRKWQNTFGARGWLSYNLPTTSSVFAPTQLFNDSGINVFWAGYDSATVTQRYNYLNANSLDDIGIARLVTGSGSALRQWAITANGTVYIRATGGGLGSNASATFTKVNSGVASLGSVAAVVDDSGAFLFASAGTTLYRISASGQAVTWSMPGYVNTLISAMGSVWVGAGNTIFKVSGDSMTQFATIPLVLGINKPIFCINKEDLYAGNGTVFRGVKSGAAPTPTSFLATSESGLSLTDLTQLGAAKSGLLSIGPYCGNSLDADVFTQVVDASAPTKLSLIRISAL